MQKAALPLALTQNICDSEIKQAFCEDLEHSSVHEVSDLLQNKIDLSLLVITKHPRHALWRFFWKIYCTQCMGSYVYIILYTYVYCLSHPHVYIGQRRKSTYKIMCVSLLIEIWTQTQTTYMFVGFLRVSTRCGGHSAKVPMRRTMQQSRPMWSWPSACGSFALRDVTVLVQEATLAILHSGYDCSDCFMFSCGYALCLSKCNASLFG